MRPWAKGLIDPDLDIEMIAKQTAGFTAGPSPPFQLNLRGLVPDPT